jgi:NSS family neurotransmitter:Na+ symporter
MGQSFFTLSLGIGSMLIFGSYIEKNNSLTGESINIMLLDTAVAIMSGLIIFPAAASFNVDAGAGPGLIFITLPNIFNSMAGGRIWGTLFFIFMSFAALTTIVAVFENIVAFGMELFGLSRKKSVLINIVAVTLLSIPCVLGFNLWSGFTPLGSGSNILDLEDFIVSNNLLPLGSLLFVLFCTLKCGWGYDKFIEEADTGNGIKFPKNKFIKFYVKYIIPVIIIGIFVYGYLEKFVL